jgi:hypothetical protein
MLVVSGTILSVTKRVHMALPQESFGPTSTKKTILLAWMTLTGWCVLIMVQALC